MKIYKVAHLTSAHPRNDVRILHKMCISLAKFPTYKLFLVVNDGEGNDTISNVQIFDVGRKKSRARLNRLIFGIWQVYWKSIRLNADIYHIHDPELIIIGLLLRIKGKHVIYDSHEDLPKQILGKTYLPKKVRVTFSKVIPIFETIFLKYFSGIIGATPIISKKYNKVNKRVIDINNYPIIEELFDVTFEDKIANEVCYVGGIDRSRGIFELVRAISLTSGVTLNLAGNFKENNIKSEVTKEPGWEKVKYHGYLDRDGVKVVFERSKLGLVILHPQTNYLESLPVKMFEYMAAGLPVLASNFPMWEEILTECDCGICVNPLNTKEISDSIISLLSDEKRLKEMSENGKKAVLNSYNWTIEEKKLLNFYEEILRKN